MRDTLLKICKDIMITTIFDPIWIKDNTNVHATVTFSFKKQNIAYADEAEWQTIYYDVEAEKYSLTDDWGGQVFLTWDEFLDMLKERNVERLVEMSFNTQEGGMIDKRKSHPRDGQETLDTYSLMQGRESPEPKRGGLFMVGTNVFTDHEECEKYNNQSLEDKPEKLCQCTQYRLCQQHDAPSGYHGIW